MRCNHECLASTRCKIPFQCVLDARVNEWPQLVTRRGAETAVLIPIAEWKRVSNAARQNHVEYAKEEGNYDEIREYLAGTGGKRRMGF